MSNNLAMSNNERAKTQVEKKIIKKQLTTLTMDDKNDKNDKNDEKNS
tara:strand:+ start:40 stop:180 length:141 start_codon:yes stop_codon:yes gene_type:complete